MNEMPKLNRLVYEGFVDLDPAQNLDRGLEFHAAGLIVDYHDLTAKSGKHLVVAYINPWGEVSREWRDVSEVRRQPMDPADYEALQTAINNVEQAYGK